MPFRNSQIASVMLGLAAIISAAFSCWYYYKTGCTADLKTGSLGNPKLALHFAAIGFYWFISAIASGTAAIALARPIDISVRAGLALMFFFVGGIALWLVDGAFETTGIQNCFAP